MTEQFSNFGDTTLVSAIGTNDVTIVIASAANFPSAPPFRITIKDSVSSAAEICLCTAISGTTLTVTRGYEGTTPLAHIAGAQVLQAFTAGAIQSIFPRGRVVTSTSDAFGAYEDVLEVNQSGGACSILEPQNPIPWKPYRLVDGGGNSASNAIALITSSGVTQFTINDNGGSATFYYNASGSLRRTA